MRVADTAEAAAWHQELFGAEVIERGPGQALVYGNGLIMTMPTEGETPPSQGGVIDHFGIAVDDVPATVAKAREMGAIVRTEPQVGVTAETIAFIEDPWGNRMELLEDPVYKGVNHVHIMADDPDRVHAWFLQVFGGEDIPARGKGIFHTILYGDLWVHVSKPAEGVPAPSRYRALDHMGFRVPSLEEFGEVLEASGYEPYLVRANPPGSDLMFFEGPEGIHFEIAEVVAP
jgi:catechol 2,3-dioxygenase-like lactoylglutathione lyase family enzyme